MLSLNQGQCTCHEMTSSPIYIKPGHTKAVVEWPIPQFTCKAGRKATVMNTQVTPQITSPHAFSIGEHTINYTFKLKGKVSVTCPVIITVKGELLKWKHVTVLGYTFMSRNKQSRKYLIDRSYKNDEFDWPFDLVTVA